MGRMDRKKLWEEVFKKCMETETVWEHGVEEHPEFWEMWYPGFEKEVRKGKEEYIRFHCDEKHIESEKDAERAVKLFKEEAITDLAWFYRIIGKNKKAEQYIKQLPWRIQEQFYSDIIRKEKKSF